MEFTYTLTEDDYLKAATIKIAPSSKGPWSRIISVTYIVLFYFCVAMAVVTGRALEWFDLNGDKLGNLPIAAVISSSIVPTAILPLFIFILFKVASYLPNRKTRIEQFRSCIGCTVATTAVFSPQSVAFRSEAGVSESSWKCFAGWKTQDGLLILVNHANTRHILKIASLNQTEQSELMQVLSTALPQA